MAKPKDNSTIELKVAMRRAMIRDAGDAPFVLEAYAGAGAIFERCYRDLPAGVAIDKDPAKADILAARRPTWAVYQGDCVAALADGLGADFPINCLDLDPYGDPWPALDAFLGSDRTLPDVLHVAANDGLRQNVQLGCAWKVASLREAVAHFGNDLYRRYLDVCRFQMETKAAQAGYRLGRWHAYGCGMGGNMSHYLARLERANAGP